MSQVLRPALALVREGIHDSLDHHHSINFALGPPDLVENLIRDITRDVVVVTRAGVGPHDGSASQRSRRQLPLT